VLYSVSSFHRPGTIYRHDLESGTRSEWWREPAPIDPGDYVVDQVRYASKDGTKVPMFVVHHEGLEKNGRTPTLLTGYGGFGVNRTPRFSESGAAWLKLGGVLAVANLRGGGELGEAWHRAGMLDVKQNTFDDFIAAAEWLVEQGYTQPERLGIIGGSNGGLLVGAAMVQRPDLFGAVVCQYPLLDMLRYHQFLVARFWVPEYGSAEDPEQFEFLRAYSPYHNVEQGVDYPAVLFITGDGDTRVAPLHARKMTALVQDATGSDEPVLLRYHTKAGHAGAKPVSQEIEDAVDLLAFLTWQLGLRVDS
jgi:prolyl oligopeptidase